MSPRRGRYDSFAGQARLVLASLRDAEVALMKASRELEKMALKVHGVSNQIRENQKLGMFEDNDARLAEGKDA